MIATVTLNPSLDEWMELPALRVGTLNRAGSFARYPGGKGINVSRVVHELGGRTCAFGLAGGEDGAILRHRLDQLGIRHDFVAVEGSTRNNYKIRTRAPRALTEINTAGPWVSRAYLQTVATRVLASRPRPACVVLSGSLPPGVPTVVYQRWIDASRRRNIPTVLDASGAALRQGVRARPWLMKPNRDEAQELLGRSIKTLAQASKAVIALRPLSTMVILSLGKEGALMASALYEGVWYGRPPQVRVDSTVGAGDSLVGGFVVGWVKRQSMLEAFRLGIACGAATAMTPGTELCHRADVQRLLSRVTLSRIA